MVEDEISAWIQAIWARDGGGVIILPGKKSSGKTLVAQKVADVTGAAYLSRPVSQARLNRLAEQYTTIVLDDADLLSTKTRLPAGPRYLLVGEDPARMMALCEWLTMLTVVNMRRGVSGSATLEEPPGGIKP